MARSLSKNYYAMIDKVTEGVVKRCLELMLNEMED